MGTLLAMLQRDLTLDTSIQASGYSGTSWLPDCMRRWRKDSQQSNDSCSLFHARASRVAYGAAEMPGLRLTALKLGALTQHMVR